MASYGDYALLRAHAAVDAVLGSGDETAFIRGQEEHEIGDVDGFAIAPQRDRGGKPRARSLRVGRIYAPFERTHHLRIDR